MIWPVLRAMSTPPVINGTHLAHVAALCGSIIGSYKRGLIDGQSIGHAHHTEVFLCVMVAGYTKYGSYGNYNVDNIDKSLEYAIFGE